MESNAPPTQTQDASSSSKKRKRASLIDTLGLHDKEARIADLSNEIQALFRYYDEVMGQKLGLGLGSGLGPDSDGPFICLIEESPLPLSKLVEEIYSKLKDVQKTLTLASVKSRVVSLGERKDYGVHNDDADVFEDDSPDCLWCWENRDVKSLPRLLQGEIRIRRTCRKMIHDRISAILALLAAYGKSEDDPSFKHDLKQASDKLGKVLGEDGIRSYIQGMIEKNKSDMTEKKVKQDQKAALKQLEKTQRESEKEKKRMERELQKEKLKVEKELKRMQEEEEKRRAKEENELRKQLKKQQEDVDKDLRQKEKESAEKKRQHAVQKQASFMESFLKRSKTSPSTQDDKSSISIPCSSDKKCETIPEAVTVLIDTALSSNQEIIVADLLKSHKSSWHSLGWSIRSNRGQHWGIRRKPKTELIKELKLTSSAPKGSVQDDELCIEVDKWTEKMSEGLSSNAGNRSHPEVKKCIRSKQLLQFDKSHRPAFYGIWPKKSQVIGPRHPLRKDPELDYEVDSDEEWEEEDPGESLSDCEKDGEESLEGSLKADEEDDNEDGFFVPDGYLSEDECVEVDQMETDIPMEEFRSSEENTLSEQLSAFFRQQKYLHGVTEHALQKNQPLILVNLAHEKSVQLTAEDSSGTSKVEEMCLQALSMRLFPGSMPPEISVDSKLDEEEISAANISSTPPPANAIAVPDTELPTIVSAIRSCPQGINKVVDALQQKLPAVSKTRLRNKVREISEFVDNRWQVKKEILDKLGLPDSPDTGGARTQGIAAFFSKRCLPPADKNFKPDVSTQPS